MGTILSPMARDRDLAHMGQVTNSMVGTDLAEAHDAAEQVVASVVQGVAVADAGAEVRMVQVVP